MSDGHEIPYLDLRAFDEAQRSWLAYDRLYRAQSRHYARALALAVFVLAGGAWIFAHEPGFSPLAIIAGVGMTCMLFVVQSVVRAWERDRRAWCTYWRLAYVTGLADDPPR